MRELSNDLSVGEQNLAEALEFGIKTENMRKTRFFQYCQKHAIQTADHFVTNHKLSNDIEWKLLEVAFDF